MFATTTNIQLYIFFCYSFFIRFYNSEKQGVSNSEEGVQGAGQISAKLKCAAPCDDPSKLCLYMLRYKIIFKRYTVLYIYILYTNIRCMSKYI